jgi:hypothetical protein
MADDKCAMTADLARLVADDKARTIHSFNLSHTKGLITRIFSRLFVAKNTRDRHPDKSTADSGSLSGLD